MWKSEASSQGPARIDHFGSVPWNSEASPWGAVGTAHFGSVLWNSEASPWGRGGTDHFGAAFPEPSSGIFFRPARTNPLGSALRGRGRFDHFGLVSPNSEASSRASWRRDAAPPAAGCCSFKKCKGFRAGPHPFPHRPAGRDFGVSPPPAKFLGCWQGNHVSGGVGSAGVSRSWPLRLPSGFGTFPSCVQKRNWLQGGFLQLGAITSAAFRFRKGLFAYS